MEKKVTAELVQYHIMKIRVVIEVGLGVRRPLGVTAIEKNVGPEAQRIVNGLITTLAQSIEYYSEDAPKVDKIVWPLPKTNSPPKNSEILIKEANATRDDLEKLPGEVQREVDACVDYHDLLSLAKRRQANALDQEEPQKRDALLFVSFKIRCRAMKNKAGVDGTLGWSWFDDEVDKIRLTLKDANSEDLGERTQMIIDELWDTLQTQKRMVHKKRTQAPQVWLLMQPYDRARNQAGQFIPVQPRVKASDSHQ
ncbi:hypothetical protein H0H93_015758 [Arthromyces matolae]|nr:hypothetical protein H0H93_015758 [Arthromyces matolae]